MTITGTIIQVRAHTNKAERLHVTVSYESATTIGSVTFDTEPSPAWYVGRPVTITIEAGGAGE